MLDQLIIHPLMADAQLLGFARRPCWSGRIWRLRAGVFLECAQVAGDVYDCGATVKRNDGIVEVQYGRLVLMTCGVAMVCLVSLP